MASLTIRSSSTVFPSHPTPAGTLSLSENDQFRAWTHVPTVYVYKPPAAVAVAAVDSLKNSLSQILVPYYPLAGRLRLISGGRLELLCCAAGAPLIEASSTAKLDDYGDFAPSDALQQLAPKVDYDNSPIEEVPMLLVQVTRFSCGGLVVGITMSHTLADGAAAITFINSWASMARGEKTMESIMQPFHDRKVLQPQKPVRPSRFHHHEYDEPPLLLGCSDCEEEQKKESKFALLKLSKEQVETLKKRANSNKPNPNTSNGNMVVLDEVQPRPYSRFESITGHIWVCACKARNTVESRQPTVVRIVVDIGQRLRTPIPKNFIGNSSLITVTPQCEFGDLRTQPLSFAAGKIREGTWKMTDEYAKSAMDFLARKEDISWVRTQHHSVAWIKASFWGNPNLALGSWMSMPLYDADFGWGRPCYVGPATVSTDGKAYIMSGPTDDGSLIIAIRLQVKHMDDFKKFFYEDL